MRNIYLDDGRILTVPLTESNVPDGGSPGDSYINSSNDAVASRAIELDYNEPSIDLYGNFVKEHANYFA